MSDDLPGFAPGSITFGTRRQPVERFGFRRMRLGEESEVARDLRAELLRINVTWLHDERDGDRAIRFACPLFGGEEAIHDRRDRNAVKTRGVDQQLSKTVPAGIGNRGAHKVDELDQRRLAARTKRANAADDRRPLVELCSGPVLERLEDALDHVALSILETK